MRWIFFLIVTYLTLSIQSGLSSLFVINNDVLPNLLLILGVFVSVYAPQTTTLWAMLLLGVLTDLMYPIQGAGPVGDFVLVGPNAVGFVVGGWAALQLRGIFRRSIPGIVATVLVVCFFVELAVVAAMTVRGLPWPVAQPLEGWSAADELVRRFWCMLYTTALSIPVIYLLGGMQRLFHFDTSRSGQSGYVMR
jgi:cell shape-determining protein MreD